MGEPGQNIADRLLDLAVAARAIADQIRDHNVKTQLSRAVTAAGSHYEEARAPESRADFIHKIGIATKELREARYWLAYIDRTNLARVDAAVLDEARQLTAILMASRRTASSRK